MKRLLFIAFALFALNAFGLAQTKEKHPAKSTKVETASKATTTKATPKPANETTALPKSATASPTKVKKDGTADMRYKENKEAAKPTASTSAHVKKDGTPDKRYKENKKKG
jgi:hypothetical protein